MILRILNSLKNTTLKRKAIAVVLLNTAIILVCSIIAYTNFSNVYNDLLYQTVAKNLTLSAGTISENLENAEALSYALLSDPTVQNSLSVLQNSSDDLEKSNASHDLNTLLFNYLSSYRSISGIDFISLNTTYSTNCTNWGALNKISSSVLEEAHSAGTHADGSPAFTLDRDNNYLLLTRRVKKISNLELTPIGNILIALDMESIIRDATEASSWPDHSAYIITDTDEDIVYASAMLSQDDILFYTEEDFQDYQIASHNGHSFFILRGQIPQYNYTYINLIAFDSILSTTRSVLISTAFIFCAGIVLILFLFNHIMRYIIKQLDNLIDKMHDFTANKMLVLPSDAAASSNDELATLHCQFNSLAVEIQSLIRQNYVNKLLTKEAQLKALKAQINPHFLYNTLESINYRAKIAGNEEISLMTEALGKLLRSSFADTDSLIPLSRELETLNSYMIIQKIRYEERLIFDINISSNLETALIPPLIIQPLAENSVRYGLEEMVDSCHIYVSAVAVENILTITVSNEGSSFDEGLLEKLAGKDKSPSGFGIGLLNISERIQLLFGTQYGLSFRNENDYAIAAITLPYITEVPENAETSNC